MRWSWLLLAVCAVAQEATAAALPPSNTVEVDEEPRNANHIFNAIHSSMRQWGSSLNHNGMSLFLAQVPAGVQFYHGTGHPEPVKGMEWLAFEPEHAINFARSFKGPGKKPPRQVPSIGKDRRFGPPKDDKHYPRILPAGPKPNMRDIIRHHDEQAPMMSKDGHRPPRGGPGGGVPGWLHTYKTKTSLPLLYIDGMSAGKCDKGTLDTQDILLLNATQDKGHDVFWEGERAERLCQMATERWNGKVKGFIRMEAGFEVILCSFADNLDIVRSVRAGPVANGDDASDPDDRSPRWQLSDWIRAITARYDGIGGNRVKLYYNNFVTAYDYDIDLFTRDDGLPRLENASKAVLHKIRDDVDNMVNNWEPTQAAEVDWQSIADMVVERYAKELKHLVSGSFTTPEQLSEELRPFLRVFVDSDTRNTTAEVSRCASQFIPHSANLQSVAVKAIRTVTTTICSTLFAALDPSLSISDSMASLHSLIEYLDWTVWKRCPECALDEICFVPIWPFGAKEDHEHPHCLNATELNGRSGYWGGFGPGHPPPPNSLSKRMRVDAFSA